MLKPCALLALLVFSGALLFSCKKKKVSAQEETTAPAPLTPGMAVDYRDAFCGSFAGQKITYNLFWSTVNGPMDTISYIQNPPVSYTLTIKKVAGADSLIWAEEFDLRQNSSYDTIVIRSNGKFLRYPGPYWGYSSNLRIAGDSLILNTDYGAGAQGNIHNGARYRCKKIAG